jgi:regulator of sigma E protease
MELMSVGLLILGLILFIGLVVVHEFGHFIVARRNSVEVEEFGIFFPPRLYKRKTKAGWLFTINALPLGGFVKLKGEHDSDTTPGSFGAADLWTKSKIMAAGVFLNLVTALVLFTALAWIGMPRLLPNQFTVKSDTKVVSQQVLISDVEAGSPAQKAGLKSADTINSLKLPGQPTIPIDSSDKLHDATAKFAGKTVELTFTHHGQKRVSTVKLLDKKTVEASQKTKDPKGYLGVVPTPLGFATQRSTWSAPVVAVGLSAQVTALTYHGLGHALAGLGSLIGGAVTGNHLAREHGQTAASSQVSGPIGIFVVLKTGSLLGFKFMLFIIAVISLTLALINILPIPALDGGRLWITLAAHRLKKPLSAQSEELINLAGFLILISLIILVSIVDVHRIF